MIVTDQCRINELMEYKVKTMNQPIDIKVHVPGSKSITNRALLLAALANGESLLEGALFSDDSRHFLQCLIDLGFPVIINEEEKWVKVTGFGGSIPKQEASIYVGSAGTAARFLTAMLGLSDGIYHLDASEQMRKRPMKPLLSSLESMGVSVTYHEKEGYFPFTIHGSSNTTDRIQVDIGSSSQFLSALLMSAPMKKNGLTIELVGGKHALSYVQITTRMMEEFGCITTNPMEGIYHVEGNQSYTPLTYQIEPDVSAACYFYAMAAVVKGTALVHHVHFDSMQGDIGFLKILEQMGCVVTDTKEGILVDATNLTVLKGIEVDMSGCSDQTMTLAAIAPFADGPVRIRGVEHIRLQECNRIEATQKALTSMGITCVQEGTGIDIYPGDAHGAFIDTFEDHRVAMAFAVSGLKIPGVVILDPMCCKKTFENYFEVLDSLY